MTLSPSSGISWQTAEAVRDKTIMDAGKRAQKKEGFWYGETIFYSANAGERDIRFPADTGTGEADRTGSTGV